MRLNVRCCCQPQKILGTMPVPINRPGTFSVQEPYRFEMASWDAEPVISGGGIVACEIRQFGNLGDYELAVYSDDRPVEFWRSIPGFRES